MTARNPKVNILKDLQVINTTASLFSDLRVSIDRISAMNAQFDLKKEDFETACPALSSTSTDNDEYFWVILE
jgi:hypothetical protein